MPTRESTIRNQRGGLIGLTAIALLFACTDSVDESIARIEQLKNRLEHPSRDDVIVVAHRTCWQSTAENSISGIRRCVELGVDMIEIDVRESSDGHLVVIHDRTIDRTTDGVGIVSELALDQLKRLRLKAGDGSDLDATVTDESVPTLREALRETRGKILVNLDIKEDLHDRALEIAREEGVASELLIKMSLPASDPKLAAASFHDFTYFMPIVKECIDDARRTCTKRLSGAIHEYRAYDPVAVEVVNHTDDYLIEGAEAVFDAGMRLWVNTLGPNFAAGRSDEKSLADPDGNWGYLVDLGVNMIQTDRPEELIEYLESRGNRRER